jgi:Fusaric acid resistance protein-like
MSEDRKFPSSALPRGLAGMRHALGSRGRRFRNLAGSDRAYTALIIRMAFAATLAYSISLLFFDPSGRDITAPMTTVLIMQGSLFATLWSGLRRVAAVFSGAVIGTGLAAVVPLQWWSLALVIPVAMAAGYALDLREHLGETAVTALLVYATAAPGTAGGSRMLLTLIGTGIGMAFMYLVPQRAPKGLAAGLAQSASEDMGASLHLLSDRLADRHARVALVSALSELQGIGGEIAAAEQATTRENEARRLTAASLASDDTFPLLHEGIDALRTCNRHLSGHLQGVLEDLGDEMPDHSGDDLAVITATFDAIADSVAALGALLGEAGQSKPLEQHRWDELEARLAAANANLRAQRENHRTLGTGSTETSSDFIAFAGSLTVALASAIRVLDERRWHQLWLRGRSRFGTRVRQARGRIRRRSK